VLFRSIESRGRQFDPLVVDAFVAVRDEFRAIAARFADDETPLRPEEP
jgi:putative two-component system response regulator